ncbi:MAG: crotonase/enoyl-CoA hydratase family protein [Myxococcales bacterium]|nr:crotonase/enoyl-CoA hydratase family protein [Myxococcales bacterium]
MSVTTESRGSVLTVLLSRPERRNAVDAAAARALEQAFRAFDSDDQHHVAVLHGEHGTFCAGADLKALAAGDDPSRLDIDEHAPPPGPRAPMGPTRLALSKPVIAAIAGHAVAGGLELAIWCDLRVMEDNAVLGVFCRRFGVPLIDGGTVRLPRLIGHGRAMDLILTGRPVHAAEALAIGLVDRVVPRGQARAAAEALAADIAAFPQACLRADRRSAHAQWDMSSEAALRAEARGGMHVIAAESLAGARRFADGAGRHGAGV